MTINAKIVFQSHNIELYKRIREGAWQSFVVIFKFFPNKGKFPLGWNGSRFATGSEYDRLKNFSPEILAQVELFLRKHYSDGENEYQSIATARDVTKLIHFTKEKNLERVMNSEVIFSEASPSSWDEQKALPH